MYMDTTISEVFSEMRHSLQHEKNSKLWNLLHTFYITTVDWNEQTSTSKFYELLKNYTGTSSRRDSEMTLSLIHSGINNFVVYM